jgi:hypothetical protein
MTIKWLGTTAIALVIGSGAVIAQSQPDLPQKREESPRAQAPSLPSKEADRPAAGEHQPADRLKNRAAQPEPKAGAKEPQRGEAPSSPERWQAQEPTPPRDTKQPLTQSQEKQGQERQGQDRQSQPKQSQEKQGQEMRREEPPGRGERAPAGSAQRENQQSGRDAERPAEPKQQLGRDRQPKQDTRKQDNQKQDNQAPDAKQPAASKQQQGQRQPSRERNDQGRDRNDQAAQPSTIPPAQQGARPGDTDQNRQQGQSSGQAPDQTARRGATSSATINDQQRTQIVERLRRDRAASNQNINIQVNIGQRLPPRVRARPLPPDIVRIAPHYRGYQYTVVEDEIVIVHPRTHEVVDVIREPGSAVETTSHVRRERVVLAREQRETLKQAARRMTTAPVSGSPSASMPDSGCLALQPVPEELVRANPELSSYRYLAIGDQVVLVDPREQKIVEVID